MAANRVNKVSVTMVSVLNPMAKMSPNFYLTMIIAPLIGRIRPPKVAYRVLLRRNYFYGRFTVRHCFAAVAAHSDDVRGFAVDCPPC